jgi:subtilisin family serine protease
MKKQSLRISMIATPLMIVCGLLASGVPARAQSDSAGACSNSTLSGNYGFAAEGVLIGVPGLPTEAQFRSVGIAHFDGKGNLTWLENTVVNGMPLGAVWTAASGTYAVNPNCTGTAVVITPNSPVPLNLAFVVVNQGKEIHSVENANAIATVFIKVHEIL